MSDKEEQFPFQQFIQALQSKQDIKKNLKNIINGINAKNINWAYSAISAIVQLLKNKEEEPSIKCRCLQTIEIIMSTCNYIPIIFIQVYVLPILYQIACYRSKKTEQLTSYYFQKTFNINDSQQTKRFSLQYVQRSIQLIHCGNQIKPHRLVEIQQLKELSSFGKHLHLLKQKGIQELTNWKYVKRNNFKDSRKHFLQKLNKFHQQSDNWVQFLLVNLLQEVKSNQKQLLQLRLLLPFGQAYMTSAIINFCEDQLLQMIQNIDLKRKYLGLLNELVRNGDIQAIIMIKNSEFLPFIVSHFGKLPGNTGLQVGQNIFPQIKGTKQLKKQFYIDFLRCLQTWAITMPQKYDSQQFKIKQIYKYLKDDKKFKFPQNFNLNRFQKEINDNLQKNAQRNDKIVELLQNMPMNQTQLQVAKSKFSNVLQKTTNLGAVQLSAKIQEIKACIKQIMAQQKGIDSNFKILNTFKDEWITYLQSLDLQDADQQKLQDLIVSGEKVIQDIQSINPFYNSYSRKKITYKIFQERMKQIVDFHNDLSVSIANTKGKNKSIMISKMQAIKSRLQKSKIDRSKMDKSKFDRSKLDNSNLSKSHLGGKHLLQKLKSKSILKDTSKLNLTKLMDRSNILDKSKSKIMLQKQANYKISQNMKQRLQQQNEQSIQTKRIMKDTKQHKKVDNLQMTQSNKFKIENQQMRHLNKQKVINSHQQSDGKKEMFKIIEDYETIQKKQQNGLKDRLNESSSSRNSRILKRRGDRDGSLQKSQQRNLSSRNSLKKSKQNSLIKRPSRLSHNVVIENNNQQQILSRLQIGKNNQKIQLNGNVIVREKMSSSKKLLNQKQQKINLFKNDYGVSEISSIHSNSVLKAFNNSAEKLLDITGNHQALQTKQMKKNKNQTKDNNDPQQKPILGDYYTQNKFSLSKNPVEAQKKSKTISASKKFTVEKVLQIVNSPKRQNIIKNDKNQKLNEQLFESNHKNVNKTTNPKKIQSVKSQKQLKNLSQYQDNVPTPTQIKSLKIVQKQKNKEITSLQQKIMQLQKQALQMKTKIAVKDYQLKSIKSVSRNKSQKGFYNFTTTSQSGYDPSQKQSLRNSSAQRTSRQTTKFQIQVQSGFKQYLERIKGSTFRKSLLKQKCLVHKNDELEIGCVSQKVKNNLICTLFITPHRYNLIDFTMGIIHDSNSNIKASHDVIQMIPKKKQQKIQLSIEIIKIPFCLIEIQINYKADSQYSSNYNRLTLPLAFNKFCDVKPIQGEQTSEKPIKYVRSDNFKINPKILKIDKLIDSFPSFSVIPIKKQRNHYMLSANCMYMESIFNIMINIQDTQLWIEGFLKQGEAKHMNFLICTFKEILDGGRK